MKKPVTDEPFQVLVVTGLRSGAEKPICSFLEFLPLTCSLVYEDVQEVGTIGVQILLIVTMCWRTDAYPVQVHQPPDLAELGHRNAWDLADLCNNWKPLLGGCYGHEDVFFDILHVKSTCVKYMNYV